jgi:transglutaminase-like putative cysteine protease
MQSDMQPETSYLEPTDFIDSDAACVRAFAFETIGDEKDPLAQAIRLYHAVRDGIVYDPYIDYADPANYRASSVLEIGRGFCVGKAALLSACARALGIPARVGYADVRNHMTSPRLRAYFKTDLFCWHSYSDLMLKGKWVKATPAFNAQLCRRVGLDPLDFDGRTDSLFQAFDRSGRRRMEYLTVRGAFEDVPFRQMIETFRSTYPDLFSQPSLTGDFAAEAVAGDA